MLIERRWELPNLPPFYDLEASQSDAAWSHLFYCHACGEVYAKVKSWICERVQPWKATNGCCLRCKGSRYTIPGSIESLSWPAWQSVPKEAILYQLNCELNFAAKDELCLSI